MSSTSAAPQTSGTAAGGSASFGSPTAPVWGPIVCVLVFFIANVLTWAGNENSWPYRHVYTPIWRRLFKRDPPHLLFISNRAEGVPRHARPKSYWAFDLISPAHLVQSYILSTPGLLVLHFVTFAWFVCAVCVDVIREYYGVGCGAECGSNSGAYGDWVTYLTNWSLVLFGLAALVAFANTARHLYRVRHSTSCAAARMQKFETRFEHNRRERHEQAITGAIVGPGEQQLPAGACGKLDVQAGATNAWAHLKWDWLSALHCLLMETATSAAFFVAFWYWVGVVGVAKDNPGPPYAGTVLAHGVNVIFALLQVYLTRLPIVSYHFQVLLWYGTTYAVVILWIYGGVSGNYRYGLDWKVPRAAIAQILIPPICIIMFTIWYYVALVREGAVFTARKIKEEVVELHEHHRERHQNHHAPAGAGVDAAAPHQQQQQQASDAAAIIVNDEDRQPGPKPSGAGGALPSYSANDVEAGRAT